MEDCLEGLCVFIFELGFTDGTREVAAEGTLVA